MERMQKRSIMVCLYFAIVLSVASVAKCIIETEPLCLSKYDYDYKILSKLVELEHTLGVLSEKIEADKSEITKDVDILQAENKRLIGLLNAVGDHSSLRKAGNTYTRWGRTTCPGNGTELVYTGYVGGSSHVHKGSAAEYICLPKDPTWSYYEDTVQETSAFVYGAEYELGARNLFNFFGKNVRNEDVPCAVCSTVRAQVVMIPGRNACYDGWTLEFNGYLTADYYDHPSATQYVCLDGMPESLPNSRSNDNGRLFYFVEVKCGSLPCPPYVQGRELACVVCSK